MVHSTAPAYSRVWSAFVPGVYEWPEAYELAYAFRDVAGEVSFALELARRSLGRSAQSAVELGAGPACHARELARRGLRAVALDIEPGAADYVRSIAPEVETVTADLRAFRLAEPVDLALCPLGTFAYLLTDDDQRAALAAAHDNLTPGGLLVLELLPIDAYRGAPAGWTVCRGEREVRVEASATRWLSAEVYEWELSLTLKADGRTETVVATQRQRVVTARQAEPLLREAGFVDIRLFADWDTRRRWRDELAFVVVGSRRDR